MCGSNVILRVSEPVVVVVLGRQSVEPKDYIWLLIDRKEYKDILMSRHKIHNNNSNKA